MFDVFDISASGSSFEEAIIPTIGVEWKREASFGPSLACGFDCGRFRLRSITSSTEPGHPKLNVECTYLPRRHVVAHGSA
jgi:hypothetical protein